MIEAIIAVSSTVIGAILGWILANIRIGKVFITLADFKEEPLYVNPSTMHIPGKKDNELYYLEMDCTIQIYNSSQTNRAIRDCELIFVGSNGEALFSVRGEDKDTMHKHGGGYRCDVIEVINIEPFTSKNVKFVVYVNDIDLMYKTKTVYFKYKTERLKTKKMKYKDIDFGLIPRFYKEETPV
ncbi:MAG: hypothetical protein A4E53_00491 [Pelotomaculum sp. PtaB.Bin104]|nr:MAG: hypothetical protein A4E53_00491 [Pelotomaculum sp. PtaB.Bin104]